MSTFEDIKLGCRVRGLDPAGIAEVVQVARFGSDALNLVFRVDGRVGERFVYRGEETSFEFIEAGCTYAFNADGSLLRLAAWHAAKRLRSRNEVKGKDFPEADRRGFARAVANLRTDVIPRVAGEKDGEHRSDDSVSDR
ncbi:MAG: hypothetical protein ACYC5H_14775 [Methylovirgula sp.]